MSKHDVDALLNKEKLLDAKIEDGKIDREEERSNYPYLHPPSLLPQIHKIVPSFYDYPPPPPFSSAARDNTPLSPFRMFGGSPHQNGQPHHGWSSAPHNMMQDGMPGYLPNATDRLSQMHPYHQPYGMSNGYPPPPFPPFYYHHSNANHHPAYPLPVAIKEEVLEKPSTSGSSHYSPAPHFPSIPPPHQPPLPQANRTSFPSVNQKPKIESTSDFKGETFEISDVSFDEKKKRADRATYSTRFQLERQPNQFQRKCYAKENRYITPHPLVIKQMQHDAYVPLKWWGISVMLGSDDGVVLQSYHVDEDAEDEKREGEHLSSPKGLNRLLLPSDITSEWSIKVSSTQKNKAYTLVFLIQYETKDGEKHIEKIISTPFQVQSNKSFMGSEPHINQLVPKEGRCTEYHKVNVKGSGFNRNIRVLLNGEEIPVIKSTPKMIQVILPPKPGLAVNTKMLVEVTNIFKKQTISSKVGLEFNYLA